jgi:single-strand DNA-binding protein
MDAHVFARLARQERRRRLRMSLPVRVGQQQQTKRQEIDQMSEVVVKVGNVGRDPELRFTPTGKAVCNFSLAVSVPTETKEDGTPNWQGEKRTDWYEIAVWDLMAENVAQSIERGQRLIVQGRGEVETYTHDGQEKTRKRITADACGPDLRWTTCKVGRVQRETPVGTPAGDGAQTAFEEPF